MATLTAVEAIIGLMSALIVVLLGVQINQASSLKKAIQSVKDELNSHILSMATGMGKKVDIDNCNSVRRDCLALNKTIIQHPLEEQIEQIRCLRHKSWDTYDKEKETIWSALRNHTHTEITDNDSDKVIFNK